MTKENLEQTTYFTVVIASVSYLLGAIIGNKQMINFGEHLFLFMVLTVIYTVLCDLWYNR